MVGQTLLRQHSPLSSPAHQRELLEGTHSNSIRSFQSALDDAGIPELRSGPLQTLQVNVGKLCNQTCRHCHVDAGPDRREVMSREVMQHCLRLLDESSIETVDITGGAPEMNPHFEWLVREIRLRGRRVIDRCNLTILLAPGYTHLPEFLAEHQVEIVASLPCYLEKNCDAQRGDGVFEKSIRALQTLNGVGYGQEHGDLRLSLVYNPVGATLPPNQQQLEAAYHSQLQQRFGIQFNRLYTLTNMPISRFLDDLLQHDCYYHYMSLLANSFNPGVVDSLMCRSLISVDWNGRLFDCDFNQMLDLPLTGNISQHVSSVTALELERRLISSGRHCYGCTAGSGSSCAGSLTEAR